MKVKILYRSKSEHGTGVEAFARDLLNQQQVKAELIEIDSKQGAELARLYDVVSYPSVIAATDSGELLQMWRDNLPLMNEVAYYANQ